MIPTGSFKFNKIPTHFEYYARNDNVKTFNAFVLENQVNGKRGQSPFTPFLTVLGRRFSSRS